MKGCGCYINARLGIRCGNKNYDALCRNCQDKQDTFSELNGDIKKECQEAIDRIESGEYVTEKEFFAESEEEGGK